MVVVPKRGGLLGIWVRVVLGRVRGAVFAERREPRVQVAVGDACDLGAVEVRHSRHLALLRICPHHHGIDHEYVALVDMIHSADVRGHVLDRLQRRARVNRRLRRRVEGIQRRGWQVSDSLS